jgi:hypothetical protein
VEYQQVTSKAIKRIGYDPEARILHVEFKNGGLYEYPDVPPETHQKFLNATSLGQHFQKHIRPHHEGTKL